jgi:hypothetical protein
MIPFFSVKTIEFARQRGSHTDLSAIGFDVQTPRKTFHLGFEYYNTSDGWTAKGYPFFFPTLKELTNELDRSFLLRIASSENGAYRLNKRSDGNVKEDKDNYIHNMDGTDFYYIRRFSWNDYASGTDVDKANLRYLQDKILPYFQENIDYKITDDLPEWLSKYYGVKEPRGQNFYVNADSRKSSSITYNLTTLVETINALLDELYNYPILDEDYYTPPEDED